jgi:hypothetical protein
MTTHITPALMVGYATGAAAVDDATAWTIEVHLESCAPCRARLADSVAPDATALIERTLNDLQGRLDEEPAPARRRRLPAARRWAAWTLLPWLAITVGALLAVFGLETAFPGHPSPVLLAAPVAPLIGMAAAWSRHTDPAWELVTGAPQGGVLLLLRRTLAVLATLAPVMALIGWATGHTPLLWLLPCLAGTAATLALGSRIGVPRAAAAVAVTWMLIVVVPAVVTDRLPALLTAGSQPAWALATVALAVVVHLRADDFRRLGSRR